jgi:hypothetical protein
MPFQAIPWEHDSDICIFRKDLDTATSALIKEGFVLEDDESQSGQAGDAARVMLPSAHARFARIYVDIFTAEYNDAAEHQLVMVRGSPQPVVFNTRDLFPLGRVCAVE